MAGTTSIAKRELSDAQMVAKLFAESGYFHDDSQIYAVVG